MALPSVDEGGSTFLDGPRASLDDKFLARKTLTTEQRPSTYGVCHETSIKLMRSIASMRTSSPSGSNGDAQLSGFFVDYLYRMKGKKNHAQDVKFLLEAMKTPPSEPDFQKSSDHTAANAGFFAIEAAGREKMTHMVMEDVTCFYKASGNPAWATCRNPLKKLGLEIVNLKRQAKCMRAEVEMAVSQQKLLHDLRHAEEAKETPDERMNRLQGFWAKFHEGNRRVDMMGVADKPRSCRRPASASTCASTISTPSSRLRAEPVSTCASTMSTPSSRAGVEVEATSPTSSQAFGFKARRPRPPSAGSTSGRGVGMKHGDECDESLSVWKSRPVRSRCSAGKWDWARGVSDTLHDSHATSTQSMGERRRRHKDSWGGLLEANVNVDRSVEPPPSPQRRSGSTGVSHEPEDAKTKRARHLSVPREPQRTDTRRSDLMLRQASTLVSKAKQMSLSTDAMKHASSLPALGVASKGRPKSATNASPKSPCKLRDPPKKTSLSTGKVKEGVDGFGLVHISDFEPWNHEPELVSTLLETHPNSLLVANAFMVPWRPGGSEPSWKNNLAPTKQYLRACDEIGCVPVPSSFASGHSLKLLAAGKALTDSDLAGFSVLAQNVPVEKVDLQGNGKITDDALYRFLESLRTGEKSLKFLSLQRCTSAGLSTLQGVTRLLTDFQGGAALLETLDLSGIAISARAHLSLAQAIREHTVLRAVHLADTGLGGTSCTSRCIGDLLGSSSLRSLDLGWNCFGAKDFDHLGERLVEMASLQSLSLANCSSAGAGGSQELLDRGGSFLSNASWREKPITPLAYFIEHLCNKHSLTSLDISLNRVDFRGALVVEDALEKSKKTTRLIISHNPLGSVGMRSLLRLLTRGSSGLIQFECDDCFQGSLATANTEFQVFSATNPGGRYQLDLSRPYHRALLRMFYKTAERFGLSLDAAFPETTMTPPPFIHATKDEHGVWQVPKTGSLSITFTIERAMDAALKSLESEWDFEGFLKARFQLLRLSPDFRKVIPMLVKWKFLEGHSEQQRVFLDALSKDFLITLPQMEQLSDCRTMASEVVGKLIHCVAGAASSSCLRFLSMLLVPTLGDCVRTLRYIRNILVFNCHNPTGSYRLDLSNASDYAVAEQLIVLDNWEVSITKRQDRFDTSQYGNYSQVRNARYSDQPLETHSIAQWVMPEFDILQFDYTSGRRPVDGQAVFDNETFSRILTTIQSSETSTAQQIQALRMCSHTIFVSSMQLRELLGLYRDPAGRAEIFVLFFNRVVDMYNEKVFRVRFENAEEVQKLRERLGFATYFPFMQPEQAQFSLDFAYHDQRLAGNVLINLAAKESRSNLRDYSFMREDGTIVPLVTGVPRSWDSFNKMPQAGFFQAKYVCSPEDRNFKCRRQFLETYGAVITSVNEEDVLWWCSMKEAPDDVLEYLEFLISNVPDVYAAFRIIDGPDGNGQITLKEFQEGYHKMGCKKFAGAREKERIQAVFRYLDPGAEGQVSRLEWGMLELLWKEVQQSIKEFVVFCQRSFGPNLVDTWAFLDEDDSGEISEEEWILRLKEIGYFGPARPVFAYLDKDDEGTVSLDEFELLHKFKQDV